MILAVVFLLLGLIALVSYMAIVLNHNLCVLGDCIQDIHGRLDATNKNVGLLGELVDTAARIIMDRLERGVKVASGSQFQIIHPYDVCLVFDEGHGNVVEVTRIVALEDSIGVDDEIELLADEEGQPGLSVTVDDCCLVRHPLDGYVELTIPIDESFEVFRDRLIGDGWEITSPEDDDGVDDDARVTPDEADRVCAGT